MCLNDNTIQDLPTVDALTRKETKERQEEQIKDTGKLDKEDYDKQKSTVPSTGPGLNYEESKRMKSENIEAKKLLRCNSILREFKDPEDEKEEEKEHVERICPRPHATRMRYMKVLIFITLVSLS